jgi:Gpi18-like mannosyltransferase
LTAAAAVIYCVSGCDWRKVNISPVWFIIIFGLLARFALISVNIGYERDIQLFQAWADRLYKEGFSNFYYADEYTDYPPGYMYALYTLGALRGALKLSDAAAVLIKTPAIICDIFTSCLIYRIAARKFKRFPAFLFGMAYAFNPAVIIDSVIWGQVDSVHTTLLFVSILALSEKRRLFSYICMALAVLVKPQSLALSPIFIYDVVIGVVRPHQRSGIKEAAVICLKGLAAVSLAALLSLPFTRGYDLRHILDLYKSTLGAYPYASVNAYNLYAYAGANWVPVINEIFPGFSIYQFGFFCLVLISVYAAYILYRGRGRQSSLFLSAAALFIFTFTLSVMMHERYLYPALVFLLAACVYRRDKRLIMFYIVYSAIFFVNCADVLKMVQNGNSQALIADSMRFVSLLNIIFTACFAIIALFMNIRPSGEERKDLIVIAEEKPIYPSLSEPALKLGRKDFAVMILLTAVYAAIAFYNLGDKTSPQTVWRADAGRYAVFELKTGSKAKTIAYMLGVRNDKRFRLSVSDDCSSWRDVTEFKGEAVFRWFMEEIDFSEKYARITSLDDELYIQELAFLDKEGAVIPISVYRDGSSPPDENPASRFNDPLISDDPLFLHDEQALIPEAESFLNSTYFDEIYHARTAYEFIHRLPVYEWTHPPLGKCIISAGALIFGMTPFGWRFTGALFGALMLPVVYIFAKKMFRSLDWAFFAAFLFAVDFMHFAQTRIATIDVFVTFFIILMYLFMYLYISLNFYDYQPSDKYRGLVFLRSLTYLLCCGIFTGLAAAAKWEGVYAMLGLPVLFFYTLRSRFREYKTAPANGNFGEDNRNLKYFPLYTLITLACCVVFFIVIPAVIYGLSYIPYLRTPNQNGLASILKNQADMFNYHAKLDSEHPYSSYWFQWPLMLRPIYYYSGQLKNGLNTGITSFGSPAVWWMGIAALLYCVSAISKHFDKTLFFLLAAYASQYLPWIFITRTTYIYHYFPSVPFVILMITYMFKHWAAPRRPAAVIIYMLAALLLFIAFYPTLSGLPIPMWYVNTFLRWMPTWSLS